MSRRVGNWTYDSLVGWRLNGTDLVIDREDHDGEMCYVVQSGPRKADPIDRFMRPAMEWVEQHRADYVPRRERCRLIPHAEDYASA